MTKKTQKLLFILLFNIFTFAFYVMPRVAFPLEDFWDWSILILAVIQLMLLFILMRSIFVISKK